MFLTLRIVRGLLIDRRGKNPGREVIVRRRRFLIGTAPDCQLRCASRLVGRHHCAIDIESDRIVLRDGASPTGTLVNGARIAESVCLFHGDRVQVGRLELEVQVHVGRVAKRLRRKSKRRPRPADIPVSRMRPQPLSDAARETVIGASDTVVDLLAKIRQARTDEVPELPGGVSEGPRE
ncbi:MAG: FHA domain-containing protein [Pirellulaceae bacterium]